jgi:hypothetical protein
MNSEQWEATTVVQDTAKAQTARPFHHLRIEAFEARTGVGNNG